MRTHRQAKRTRPGFTLIEVMTSLTIMSVLMLGLSGAVMVSSRAIPTPTETGQGDQQVVDAINRMRSELREATAITYRTGPGGLKVEIQINDVGASGTPSAITYRYISAYGTLTRKADTQAEVTLIEGISTLTANLTNDGSHASVLYLRMVVEQTIQQTYEMHALLPYRPEVL